MVAAGPGQDVLNQGVWADAEGIDLAHDARELLYGGRAFDPDARLPLSVGPRRPALELFPHLGQYLLHLEDLFEARHHRDKHPHEAVGAGAENRPQLRLKNLRHLERDADRAPAEKRILLGGPAAHVRGIFIRADVERADRHRLAVEALDDAPVDRELLLFAGKVAVREELNLGPLKAHALGAVELRS